MQLPPSTECGCGKELKPHGIGIG
jgi:hypothetical protein